MAKGPRTSSIDAPPRQMPPAFRFLPPISRRGAGSAFSPKNNKRVGEFLVSDTARLFKNTCILKKAAHTPENLALTNL